MEEACKKVYDLIFEPEFLVKYGYYDISIKNEKMIADFIDLDSNYGQSDSFYFKVFNMECFAEYLKANDLSTYFDLQSPKKNKSTEPIYFSIPKSQDSRRQYKMPNLYSYMALNYFVCTNSSEFIKAFLDNRFSTSKFFGQLGFNYKITHEIKQTLLYGGNKVLSIDLSNFYHALYTHSIPWMIVGKEVAKKEDRDSGFANHLDKMVALCQYNETHGIPTGNLISRIVAELYLCYFDKRMKEKNFVYSRYVDDFSFSFSLEVEKEEFLKEFNLICREHNLIINDKKTSVNIFPFMDATNKTSIFTFFESFNSETQVEKWVDGINTFIDYCIGQEHLGNKGAIKVIFSVLKDTLTSKKISSIKINEIFSQRSSITKFNIFEKILDLSLKDSKLTNRFLDFFEEINKLGFLSRIATKIVKEYFWNNREKYRDKIKFYAENHYNQELYQTLLYIVEFSINKLLTKKTLLNLINNNVDDYSLVLITIIYLKKKDNVSDLLEVIDQLFVATHKNYPENSIRMTEKLWFFRYFIYYLIKNEVFSRTEINSYCRVQGYETSTGKGYKTELNWKYIINNPQQNQVDAFFNNLLENNVWLVYCGENNNFTYLPK